MQCSPGVLEVLCLTKACPLRFSALGISRGFVSASRLALHFSLEPSRHSSTLGKVQPAYWARVVSWPEPNLAYAHSLAFSFPTAQLPFLGPLGRHGKSRKTLCRPVQTILVVPGFMEAIADLDRDYGCTLFLILMCAAPVHSLQQKWTARTPA